MNIALNRSVRSAFTLIEIMIVVGIIALLAAMAVPNFTKNMDNSRVTAIKSQLRAIDTAKMGWAVAERKGTGDVPNESDIAPYLQGGKMPKPVVGEVYHIEAIGTAPYATVDKPLGDYPANQKIMVDDD